jgi:Protein of unknown function (DUF3723)
MSSKVPSPITTKKPRGLAAKLTPPEKPVEVPLPEFTSQFASIERELNKHKIGTFKVYLKDMTFVWNDGENRKLAPDSQLNALRESMNSGIFRTDINNRMTGIISKDLLQGNMYPSDNLRASPLDFAGVLKMNDNAEYPVVQHLTVGVQVEMQSGQHRMRILEQHKEGKPLDQWWIVTLYDNRKSSPFQLY